SRGRHGGGQGRVHEKGGGEHRDRGDRQRAEGPHGSHGRTPLVSTQYPPPTVRAGVVLRTQDHGLGRPPARRLSAGIRHGRTWVGHCWKREFHPRSTLSRCGTRSKIRRRSRWPSTRWARSSSPTPAGESCWPARLTAKSCSTCGSSS